MKEIVELYCDGGVIRSNPSDIGGTYAYRLVYKIGAFVGRAHVLTAFDNGGPVTNNQIAMMALLAGLEQLPAKWTGTVYSDSQVTLGRVFGGWKWSNIPSWMHKFFQTQRRRFIYWSQIRYVLLDGHPTRAQLAAGVGKGGHPVSEHNVWCDRACTVAGIAYLENVLLAKKALSLRDLSAA